MRERPETYEKWKECIRRNMGGDLTLSFLENRISVFSNHKEKETEKFLKLYGKEHTARVKEWFSRLAAEFSL